MSATSRAEHEPPAALVEAALDRIGGGVRVDELAYKTGLSEVEVTDALHELEREGRAQPWAWTLSEPVRADHARAHDQPQPNTRLARRRGADLGAGGRVR